MLNVHGGDRHLSSLHSLATAGWLTTLAAPRTHHGAGGPCGEDQRHGLGPQRAGNMLAIEALKRSSRLRANVELMAVQLHALRDAMAVARVLNRTLIVPLFECLCDRSELTDVIPSCLYPGEHARGARRELLSGLCTLPFEKCCVV